MAEVMETGVVGGGGKSSEGGAMVVEVVMVEAR
jgi:hypothetical protein